MIQFVVPLEQRGGVYDFASRLNDAMGRDVSTIVHISKEDVASWMPNPSDTIVLQMSGYGFAKRGAPLWLLREIERRRAHIKSLGIFFHELYAFGPPWRSSFWLSPVQRHIARRLAELSDFWLTNRGGSAQWLRKFAGGKPHAVLPVFSNVGEAREPPSSRSGRIVVFGSPGVRERTYRAAGDCLFAWARAAGLQVHDIGSPISDSRTARRLASNGVVQHGRMKESEVSDLLRDAWFGFLAYPVEFVAKSGIFAAYAAHGVCPILLSAEHMEADGLKAGVHYLPELPDSSVTANIDSIRRAAWEWYQPHSVARHAKTLIELLDLGSRVVRC